MESITEEVNPAVISGATAGALALLTLLWIAVYGFRSGVGFGLGCLLVPFFAVYFGLTRGGKTLFLPTVVHLASVVIGGACAIVLLNSG